MRDVSNIAVDSLLNPFAAAPVAVQASVAGTRFVSTRVDLLSASNLLSQAAIDPYSFTRNLYLQRRRMLSTKSGDGDRLPNYADPSPQ